LPIDNNRYHLSITIIMRLSSAATALLVTARSRSTSRAFHNNKDNNVHPAAVGVDENFLLGGSHHQQQQKEDVISLSSFSSSSSSILSQPTKGRRRLRNNGNFMMMGKQQFLASRQGRMDADIGVLEYGPHTQYLYHNQGRHVQEADDDEGSSNITTTPFDYAYYVFCTYLNCTCSDINWAEQTMYASCDRPGNTCSKAIYVCLAENGNPTNSCSYEVSYTVNMTGPDTFERNLCKIRSNPYYEKICWDFTGENVSYSEEDGWDYDIKECNMFFNGEVCNSCTPVPTKVDYCYPDGNCINNTITCNDFDCTNTAQGKLLFSLKVLSELVYVFFSISSYKLVITVLGTGHTGNDCNGPASLGLFYRTAATYACTGECFFCGPASSLTLPMGEYQCVDFIFSSGELNGPVSFTDQCEDSNASLLYRSCFCYFGLEDKDELATAPPTSLGDKDEPATAPPMDGSASSSNYNGPTMVVMGLSASFIGFCLALL
jgi:hypothetical protein